MDGCVLITVLVYFEGSPCVICVSRHFLPQSQPLLCWRPSCGAPVPPLCTLCSPVSLSPCCCSCSLVLTWIVRFCCSSVWDHFSVLILLEEILLHLIVLLYVPVRSPPSPRKTLTNILVPNSKKVGLTKYSYTYLWLRVLRMHSFNRFLSRKSGGKGYACVTLFKFRVLWSSFKSSSLMCTYMRIQKKKSSSFVVYKLNRQCQHYLELWFVV